MPTIDRVVRFQSEQIGVDYDAAVAAAARCTELLVSKYGAARVVPFGSLRDPHAWRDDSDLDIAVEGIAPEQFFRAWASLRQVVPAGLQVDLVALETASPQLQARIFDEVVMAIDPILRLRGLIEDELQAFQQIIDLLEEAQTELANPPTQFQLNGLASYIHQFYTGCERILERIAAQVDQQLPQGAYSHANLLAQMSHAVPALRPAVIDSGLWDQLQTLLDFRHFFRHAYGYTLEWMRLKPLVEDIPNVLSTFRQQLEQFFSQLPSKGNA